MTPIDEIEALLARATPRPWIRTAGPGCRTIKGRKSGKHRQAQYGGVVSTHGLHDDEEDRANAALIERLVNCAPDLIAVVRAAQRVDTISVDDLSLPVAYDELHKALAKLGVGP